MRKRTLQHKILQKIHTQQNETIKVKEPPKRTSQTRVSPTMLAGLTIVDLRMLTRKIQLRLRSKLKTKQALIKALQGVLTPKDLTPFLKDSQELHIPPSTIKDETENGIYRPTTEKKIRHHIPPIRSQATNVAQPLPVGEGTHIKGNVMGIDVHLDTLVYNLIDDVSILAYGELPNSTEGIAQIIALCRTYTVSSVAMESTAEYWRKLYWALTDAMIPVLVANALQTKNTQGKKTDKYDSLRIAIAHRDGRLRPSVCCNQEQYALRKSLREAQKEMEMGTIYANQMRNLEQMSDAPKWVRKLPKTNYGRILLTQLPACTSLAMVLDAVKIAHPTWKVPKSEALATELWTWTQHLKQLNLWALFLNRLQNYLFHLHQGYVLQLAGVKYAQLHPEYREIVEILLTANCIGPNSAALIAAELIDIRNFPTAKGLVRWAGLNPNVEQSGFRKNHIGKISKKGDKYIRKALFCCSQTEYAHAKMPGHALGEKMRSLKEIGKKPYKKAVVAGARLLLVYIWNMLTYKEAFQTTAPQIVLEHIQESTEKKITGLRKRIEAVSAVYRTVSQEVVDSIQHFETVDTAVDFARVFLEARQKYGEGHEAAGLFPFKSLYGLSEALWKLQST